MLHPSRLGRNKLRTTLTHFVVLAVILMLAAPAFGRLSESDIAALQERAQEEGWTFTVGKTPATEYSLDQLCGFEEPPDWKNTVQYAPLQVRADLPDSFDWRDYDGCTPIKNQADCGGCWAFATVGTLECAIKIRRGITVDLSEQWLISCNGDGWDCDVGGFAAHDYHQWKTDPCIDTGPVLEADFPYLAINGACQCPYPHQDDYLIESWGFLPPGDEAIKQAILDYGPVYVSIRSTDALQAYHGGIFNAHESGPTNHAVVLIGWDDNQGTSGIWFARNSWDSTWGEGGYFRIEYGCCSVGSNANYIEYQAVYVQAQNAFGPVPLTVDFEGTTAREATSWAWDFGDGDSSDVQNPSHEYQEPGHYTVELTINTPQGPFTTAEHGLVSAYADTLEAPNEVFDPGQDARVDIFARNYLPLQEITITFCFDGPIDLQLDSVKKEGLRTEPFQFKQVLGIDPFGKNAAIRLTAGTAGHLDPGSGAVVSLYFHDKGSSYSGTNPIELTTNFGQYNTEFITYAGTYVPEGVDGSLGLDCCIGDVGNVNESPEQDADIGDMQALIDHLFINMDPLGCIEEADVNLSGQPFPIPDDVDIGDMQFLIDHLFIDMNPLPPCP